MKGENTEVLVELREQGWRLEGTTCGTKWIAFAPPPSKERVVFAKKHGDPTSRQNALHQLRRAGFVWPPKPKEEKTVGALHEDTMSGLLAYIRTLDGWDLEPTPDGQYWRVRPPNWLKAIRFPARPATLQHVLAQLREAGMVWPPPGRPRPEPVVRSVPFPPRPNPDVVVEDAATSGPLPLPPPTQDAPSRAFTLVKNTPPVTEETAFVTLKEARAFYQMAKDDEAAAELAFDRAKADLDEKTKIRVEAAKDLQAAREVFNGIFDAKGEG